MFKIKSLFGLFVLCLFCLYACSDATSDLEPTQNGISKVNRLAQTRSAGADGTLINIPFPDGTEFEIEGSVLRFQLPESHYIVGYDDAGNYYQSGLGEIGTLTCSCVEVIEDGSQIGSFCEPSLSVPNQPRCFTAGDCYDCNTSAYSIDGIDAPLVNIAIFNSSLEPLVEDFSQVEDQYFLPQAFYNYGPVQEALSGFEPPSPDGDNKIILANIMGYLMMVEVPSHRHQNNINLVVVDSNPTCICDDGGGLSSPYSCDFTDAYTNNYTWICVANPGNLCTRCKLNVFIQHADGSIRTLTSDMSNDGLISLE